MCAADEHTENNSADVDRSQQVFVLNHFLALARQASTFPGLSHSNHSGLSHSNPQFNTLHFALSMQRCLEGKCKMHQAGKGRRQHFSTSRAQVRCPRAPTLMS